MMFKCKKCSCLSDGSMLASIAARSGSEWACVQCNESMGTEQRVFEALLAPTKTDSEFKVLHFVGGEPVGRKDDGDKTRYDLIPPKALDALARVLTIGARKYAPENWRKVEGRRWRYFAAAQRHLWAWWRGEQKDPETGESHLAHALCCVAFLLDEEESNLTDRQP